MVRYHKNSAYIHREGPRIESNANVPTSSTSYRLNSTRLIHTVSNFRMGNKCSSNWDLLCPVSISELLVIWWLLGLPHCCRG
jgi:hypothetical protein